MLTRDLPLRLALIFSLGLAPVTAAEYRNEKNWDDMTPAEHTAAKRAAKTADIRPLIACADPGNMPISNGDEQGYDNRIANLLAEAMGTTMSFFWRPYLERGLTRETFDNRECDLLLGFPEGYRGLLQTLPIYRTAYVFATRLDRDLRIQSLDDPILKDMRIGVYQHSGIREALVRHGVAENIEIMVIRQNTDLAPENQQWQQVQQVVAGDLDAAAVWGPFAGYVQKTRGEPLKLQPVNLMEDKTPLEFSLAIGMRKNDVLLKYAMDNALLENAEEIEAILSEYGVPLVACSNCIVQGNLPSHGSYAENFIEATRARYLEPLSRERVELNKSQAAAHQVIDTEKLQKWLAEGADPSEELLNATLASDLERIRFLVTQGGDVDYIGKQGYGPIHEAARYRDSDALATFGALGADLEKPDREGWTALMHAALLNHVPSIQVLASNGVDLETKNREGYTALAVAVSQRKLLAAKALIEVGAGVDTPLSDKGQTALMLLATLRKSEDRASFIHAGMEPVDLAKLFLDAGSDVNARTTEGLTPLMYAAAHDNSPLIALLAQNGAELSAVSNSGQSALDYARENRAEGAMKSLELFQSMTAAAE